MAAIGSMWIRTYCGISRAARSYLVTRSQRASPLARMSTTNAAKADGKPEQTEAETETPPAASESKETQPPKQEAASPEPSPTEKALKEQNEKLESNLKELKDKYVRSLAETENVRQRMKKQVEDAKLYGIQGFCKDLLEVADILSAATHSVPKDQLTDDNPHLKNLFDGLTMTESQLQKVFGKHGLLPIAPQEGEKFDPNIHEALFQVPSPDKEENTIAIIQKRGYKLHDRTLRPAMVGVFKSTAS